MSHTQGPWKVAEDSTNNIIGKHGLLGIWAGKDDGADRPGHFQVAKITYGGKCNEENNANARLIAAAPELVAESQATVDELTGLVEWLDSIDAAPAIARKLLRIVERHRAALAKVKGE